jgi:hypothetical protein
MIVLMAGRARRDKVSAVTERIGRPVGEGSAPGDLPADAWARLFAIALARLGRARPRWATTTAGQVASLIEAWRVFARDHSLSAAERDLRLEEALEQIEGEPPWTPEPATTRGRAPSARRPRKPRARRTHRPRS